MFTAMLVSFALAQGTPIRPVDIPEDGDGLPITVFMGEGPTLQPLSRFNARAWLSWDDKDLIAKVEVTDATPMTREAPIYEGDSVELFLKSGEDMVQIVAAPGGLINPTKPRMALFDYRTPEMRQRAKLEGSAEGERTELGYVVRLRLPFSSVGIAPSEGTVVGARIGVNDLAPEGKGNRFRWLGYQAGYDFATPAPIRLAATAAPEPSIEAWAATTEAVEKVNVNVIADASFAGKTVKCGDLASALLQLEDGVATARLSFDAPKTLGGASLTVDGNPVPVDFPDLPSLRRRLFLSGDRRDAWNAPRLSAQIFKGEAFPTFEYPDRAKMEALVGPISIRATYYDANGQAVTKAEKPGRYGAVAKVSAGDLSYTLYKTVFRSGGGIDPNSDPVVAAARFEGKESNPQAADNNYWHRLRKKLGEAVRYEWYAKAPGNYDASKPWPLIVYLHGSGGGDAQSWDNTKLHDGPMEPAHSRKDFPFVAVALRSPGGWFPPAVQDAIDEVEAKYNVDRSRVYLTGFSMGGMGTWQVAYDRPDRFAAIAPVGARQGNPNLMPLLKSVPAWVFNGAEDAVCTPQDARMAVENLKKVGDEVLYTEIPHADHVGSLRYAYAQKDLYAWFLKHRR